MRKIMGRPGQYNRVILLSGPRGAGKTTVLQKLLAMIKGGGTDVAGILSLPVEEAGAKIAIDGIDLRSGETRRLAIRNTGASGQWITRQWLFDAEAMRWADRVLEDSTPCDLLVIDELGVLEFERGQGWLAGIKAIDDGRYRAAIVVIRPELLVEAQRHWNKATIIETTQEKRDVALDKLSTLVAGLLHSPKSVLITKPTK
jgi:nucleoside-triphosphatase THEP1